MKKELWDDEIIKVRQAATILTQALDKHITIPELATLVDLPEKKLKMGFMFLYKQGVYAYLKNERLDTGKKMLLESRISLSKVALKIGYNGKGSFITAFRKKYGMTPGEWRSQNKKVSFDSQEE